ncbi:MAG: hypothetical protein AB1607_16230 [Chloroflexota bacterium]
MIPKIQSEIFRIIITATTIKGSFCCARSDNPSCHPLTIEPAGGSEQPTGDRLLFVEL